MCAGAYRREDKAMRLLIVAFLLAIVAPLAAPATEAPPWGELRVRCLWMPPLPGSGSPPVAYILEIMIPEDPEERRWEFQVEHVGGLDEHLEQSFVFEEAEHGLRYQARVRAVDAQGRTGPWSDWNEPGFWDADEPDF
jgi:hypothetical protein